MGRVQGAVLMAWVYAALVCASRSRFGVSVCEDGPYTPTRSKRSVSRTIRSTLGRSTVGGDCAGWADSIQGARCRTVVAPAYTTLAVQSIHASSAALRIKADRHRRPSTTTKQAAPAAVDAMIHGEKGAGGFK